MRVCVVRSFALKCVASLSVLLSGVVLLVAAEPAIVSLSALTGATSTPSSSPITWLTDYSVATTTARREHKPLVILFHAQPDAALCEQVLAALGPARETVLFAAIPTTAEFTWDGKSQRVLAHPAFQQLAGQPGLALIDWRDATSPQAGRVLVATPWSATETPGPAQLERFAATQLAALQAPVSKAVVVRPPVRLVTATKDRSLRKLFPKVVDPELQTLLNDPHLMLYTEAEMPKAYQFWDGAHPGVHSVNYNISANGSEPFGNGNREFPWNTPAGTHRSTNVVAFRFLSLPRNASGKLQPVVWYRPSNGGYAWVFPVGTVFGEVLTETGPDGKAYTFEIRIRRRETNDWQADAFRPFPTAKDLAARIKELRPNWSQQPQLAKLVQHLDTPLKMKNEVLADRQPGQTTFRQTAGVDRLPAMGDDKLVGELLLSTPFRSAQGKSWRDGANRTVSFAPTTESPFHIVPAKYDAGFIAVDQISCKRCHETTNHSVNEFDAGRDWYGRVRGSDGIFSFHPFAPGSISHNGYPSSVGLRNEFEAAGMLERFDRAKHPRSLYTMLD